MVEFGEQLRNAREKKGMTQQTLAEQLYVTRQTVSHWERGARFPDLLTTKKISETLDVSLDDLLSGEDMNKVVEKIPVIEDKAVNNIMIVFYTIVIFSFLLSIVNKISMTPWKTAMEWVAESGNYTLVLQAVFTILRMGIGAAVFIYGLIHAYKGTLSPKRMGLVIVGYFATIILYSLMNISMSLMSKLSDNSFVSYGTDYIYEIFYWIIPAVIGIVSACLFFVQKRNGVIWPVFLVLISVCEIYQSVEKNIGMLKRVQQFSMSNSRDNAIYNPMTFVLYMIPTVLINGLIIYQVITLYRKRKIATDLSGNE
ncbi:MAG: helix-turn-helix domain-containing protein [Butyrivibrio sp.]|nr:helix-turn-helix domain-containing protein [Butyrivibrio sp.]